MSESSLPAKRQRGVALLITLFALLLITAVAVALISMTNVETAIGSNYRGSTQAFYAGYAGLEEARGRLRTVHPNTLDAALGINRGAGELAATRVQYILNAKPGEVVIPTNLSQANLYADHQYLMEFGLPVTGAILLPNVNSVSTMSGVPGPDFKWVRITAKTERVGGRDINGDGILDPVTPIFYNGSNQNLTRTGRQVLRVTTLAVNVDRSRRMLQYDVAPMTLGMTFPSALTFDGPGSALFPANSNVYRVDGNDNPGCAGVGTEPPKPAIGVVTPSDDDIITNAIPPNRNTKYTGSGPAPDVQDVGGTLPTGLSSVAELENLVAKIKSMATVVPGPASSLPNYGTETLPVIAYVDGDLSLGPVTGHGILVVRGELNLSGSTGWRGIVLVVGKGVMRVSGGGNNEFDGAILLANTLNPDGSVRTERGPTQLDWAGGGGNGVYYSSPCISFAQSGMPYQLLSFREVKEP